MIPNDLFGPISDKCLVGLNVDKKVPNALDIFMVSLVVVLSVTPLLDRTEAADIGKQPNKLIQKRCTISSQT